MEVPADHAVLDDRDQLVGGESRVGWGGLLFPIIAASIFPSILLECGDDRKTFSHRGCSFFIRGKNLHSLGFCNLGNAPLGLDRKVSSDNDNN